MYATAYLLALTASDPQLLEFDVFLDDAKIGYHVFEIEQHGEAKRVKSNASFDVKFLFVTAFRYRQSLTEQWQSGCLVTLDAETRSNGKQTIVSGERVDDRFLLQKEGEEAVLPECVMTFAYWRRDFLEASRLLNPQTGEYVSVNVQELRTEEIRAGGRVVEATAHRITGPGLEVTVWYSNDDEWLALESPARGGRTIRYELT